MHDMPEQRPQNQDDWAEYRRMVLDRLDEYERTFDNIDFRYGHRSRKVDDEIHNLELEVDRLKNKWKIVLWFVALVPTVVSIAYQYFFGR